MRRFRRVALTVAMTLAVLGAVPAVAQESYQFFPLTPCRAVDTRVGFGGALAHNTSRTFSIQTVCGVPVGAAAVAVNVTAVSPTSQGHLRVYPSNVSLPNISTINFAEGVFAIANATIAPLSTAQSNDLAVFTFMTGGSGNPVHLVLDVTGYFAPPGP